MRLRERSGRLQLSAILVPLLLASPPVVHAQLMPPNPSTHRAFAPTDPLYGTLTSSSGFPTQPFNESASASQLVDQSALGAAAGFEAANGPSIAKRIVAGVVGGFLLGAFVPWGLGSREGSLPVVAGALAIGFGAGAGSARPPSDLLSEATVRGTDYTNGFVRAYSDRLKARRVLGVMAGSVAGIAIGAGGWLVKFSSSCLVSQMDTC